MKQSKPPDGEDQRKKALKNRKLFKLLLSVKMETSSRLTKVKKSSKFTFEEQIQTMQRHFAAIVVTVKDLKSTVDALKEKVDANENANIEAIVGEKM